jgi:hypothetical protein
MAFMDTGTLLILLGLNNSDNTNHLICAVVTYATDDNAAAQLNNIGGHNFL